MSELWIPAVEVVQAGEHVAVAELFQIGLLLFAVQTVGHKELDGRQQGRVIVVRAGVVHTQKAHHGSAFHQRHRQGKKPVHRRRKPIDKRTDNSLDITLIKWTVLVLTFSKLFAK